MWGIGCWVLGVDVCRKLVVFRLSNGPSSLG